jgi:fatty acid desaturase
MRPPTFLKWMANFLGLLDVPAGISRMCLNASGRLDPQEASFIPEIDHAKVVRVARIWVLIYAGTIAAAITLGSWVPILLVGTPRLYGAWHHVMTGMLQHGGLADNVVDHRLNSRTVYMNPISRFIYWNMNYHVEHHMFPKVPFHALPALHRLIKHDLPTPSPSIAAGFVEMWPALVRQLRNENYFIRRDLPDTARPYREFTAK